MKLQLNLDTEKPEDIEYLRKITETLSKKKTTKQDLEKTVEQLVSKYLKGG